LEDQLAPHIKRIETYENPTLGVPHTRELWPTIITGCQPDVHGIRAANADGTVGWDSAWLRNAAAVGSYVCPPSLRSWVGKQLRQRGAGLSQETPATYKERGRSVIFDGRTSLAISIPNYYTDVDRVLGVSSDRSNLWDTVLADKESDGYRARVSTARLTERLCADAQRRLGAMLAGAEHDYDIIFGWIGFLDSVGHLAPPIGTDWQRRQYERVVDWLTQYRAQAPDDTSVFVVSDHGLRGGDHTHDAVLAGPTDAVDQAETVADVRAVIDAATPRRNEYPQMDGVGEQLADLGYIEEAAT